MSGRGKQAAPVSFVPEDAHVATAAFGCPARACPELVEGAAWPTQPPTVPNPVPHLCKSAIFCLPQYEKCSYIEKAQRFLGDN